MKGIEELLPVDITEELEESVRKAIDNLSERYPISNFINGRTFWDTIADKVTQQISLDDIPKNDAEILFNQTIDELLKTTYNNESRKEIYTYFWFLLKNEIILHTKLYRYIIISYNNDFGKKISGIEDMLSKIVPSSSTENKPFDIKEHKENILNYIISLQQMWINEINDNFLNRTFELVGQQVTEVKIDNLLTDKNNLILLGEPGAGKTYTLKQLLYKIAITENQEGINKIPIYIKLSSYGDRFDSITQYIMELLNKFVPEINANNINKIIKTGNLVIIMDGLDEVRKDFYEKCVQDIGDMINYSNLNRYIISCREGLYFDEFSSTMKKVKLKSLDDTTINDCLKRYCNISYPIINKEQLELFKNPLLLNIGIDVINKNEGRIPANRTIMFSKFIEYLIYKWEHKKGLMRDHEISTYETIKFFSKISFIRFKDLYIEVTDIYEFIAKEFINHDYDKLYEFILNTGIIKRDDNGSICFSHRMFQEYFAAKYIVDNIEKNHTYELVNEKVYDKRWHEVFIFAAGLFKKWDSQNYYFNFILDKNIKLFIKCIEGKNDLSQFMLSLPIEEYTQQYLNILINTYETVINKYLCNIKHLFDPYKCRQLPDQDMQVSIMGEISLDKQSLHYLFRISTADVWKVEIASNTQYKQYREWCQKNFVNYSEHSVNLKLSNLMGDSAREVAIKNIKAQLKDILDKNQLLESKYILCERIQGIKRKLSPIRNMNSLKEMQEWVVSYIEKSINTIGSRPDSISYDGVEIYNLYNMINYLISNKVNLEECLLPSEDIKNPSKGWVWNFYSNEKLLEVIRSYFIFYQLSFIEMVENNLNKIEGYLPDYMNLPYKYEIEVIFNEQKVDDWGSQPSIVYYYVGTSDIYDTTPNISVVEKQKSWEWYGKRITDSFKKHEGFTGSYSVSYSGVSFVLGESLRKNVYNSIKKNLENLFGRF